MQRYHFHLNFLSSYVTDDDGTELPDLEAAKTEARQVIRDLAAEHLKGRREFTLHSIRICAENGDLLAAVPTSEALSEVIPPHIYKPSPPDSHV
ncbi:hypothetical protein E2F50_22185 [Rhizobium deserti]|uniref:DUF6894 domain-containing protein n=1 Tax=Rhizobium deserti TaxID=2547961 RepID=A0A4R5U6L9_9HYPH|nr:hypothetical protein [Rhizobium deserti]TDK29904.1 hypothetical protein E2F50_22185 [Rhizobium deserti]